MLSRLPRWAIAALGALVAVVLVATLVVLDHWTAPGPGDPGDPSAPPSAPPSAAPSPPSDAPSPGPSTRPPQEPPADPPGRPARLRLAQANIFTAMPLWKFRDDLASVVRLRPDLVTLNETFRRSRREITPPGYTSWRTDRPFDARETPVLWRTDRWRMLDSGTVRLNNRRSHKWGIRYTNWATLERRTDGLVVSVISAHPAPTVRGTEGLLHEYLRGVNRLARKLGRRGEVLVGGDLNASRRPKNPARRYPRQLLARSGLVSTYDLLGSSFATHSGGGVIDYMLVRRPGRLRPVDQGWVNLHSDHHALWADFAVAPR